MTWNPTNYDVELVLPEPFDWTDNTLWKEVPNRDGTSTSTDTQSLDAAISTLQVDVPWPQRWDAEMWALGWAYSDNTNKKLVRQLPLKHPWKENLHCLKKISEVGMGMRDPNTDEAWDEGGPPTFAWDTARMVFEFGQLPFNTLENDEVSSESERYLQLALDSKTEGVTAFPGSFKYAEGPGATQGKGGTPASFPGQAFMYEKRVGITYIWHKVPADYCLSHTSGEPTKIMTAVGAVNSAEWNGHAKHTLLMLDPIFDIYPLPLYTNTRGRPKFLLTITLPFVKFSPQAFSGDWGGHLIKPLRSGSADAGYTPDAKYYLVTHDGTTTGKKVYPTADYSVIFNHVNS